MTARGVVGRIYTDVARRNLALVDRQLRVLDDLADAVRDPALAAPLVELERAAVRLRRGAESLLVLAGEDPARPWTGPAVLSDVVRAAAAEVVEGARVAIDVPGAVLVSGEAVPDLRHLLAELLENALSFSSPDAPVLVAASVLPDGRSQVTVVDAGLGMSPGDLDAANRVLSAPPELHDQPDGQVGLQVVGRLAGRHGVEVRLQPTDGGGTTAVVDVPPTIASALDGALAVRGPGASE